MLEIKKTTERINSLFSEKQRKEAVEILKTECGDNIPFCKNIDKYEMERIRFAFQKLSEGSIEKLIQAIELAQTN